MHIINKSKRPTYLSLDALLHANICQDSLYNEGLLLRYSNKPYDNFEVAMRNVRDIYHMEYLTEPAMNYTFWDTCDKMNKNYVTLLSHLVKKLHQKGEHETANRLHSTLSKSIDMSTEDEDFKTYLHNYLKEQSGVEQ